MPDKLNTHARSSSSALAWVGVQHELIAIVASIDNALSGFREAAEKEAEFKISTDLIYASKMLQQSKDADVADLEVTYEKQVKDLASTDEPRRVAVRRSWLTQASSHESDLDFVQTGPALEVIEAIDPRSVDGLTLTGGNLEARLEVTFGNDGCKVHASGSNQDWVRASHASVWAEVRKGRPIWRVLRYLPVQLGLAAFIYAFAVVLAAVVIASKASSTYWAQMVGLGLTAVPIIAAILHVAYAWAVPGFEVGTQADARGRTAAGWTISFIGVVLIGGAVNLITR